MYLGQEMSREPGDVEVDVEKNRCCGDGGGGCRGRRVAESARVVGACVAPAFVRRASVCLMRGYFGRSHPSDKSRPCDPA